MAVLAAQTETRPWGQHGPVPVFRGALWGAVGALVAAGLTAVVRIASGTHAWELGPTLVIGYVGGVAGWLLGVGAWEAWGRPWAGLAARAFEPEGRRRYFGFNTDHKVIGIQYLVTFVALFLLAGALAMVMRVELGFAGRTLFGPADYNRVMSLHGFTMILVAVTAAPGAFGNYLLPLMVGAKDMAFPRLNALSYWLWAPAAGLLILSPFFGGWDTGWTGYVPLATTNRAGQTFYALIFMTAGVSSIIAAVNFITTTVRMRAPGMGWGRLPIFVWSMLATALLALFFTQSVAVAMLLTVMDRVGGTTFFDPLFGGDPLAYQNIFWFYSHPAVYVMILPGLGIALEVITHLARKPLFGYWWAVGGFAGITVLSGVVWAHHMFTTGMEPSGLRAVFMGTTEAISVPTGLIFLAALGTIWQGRLWLRTPMLFALGTVFNFLIGGVTGVFLSDVPADVQLQDTFWVVAHFHYTILGGGIFGLFAGIYFWFPKMFGRMYSERLGRIHFWWMFLGFNLTFLPMFWLGINGMNRRIADYPPELAGVNLFVSVSAFVLGAGFLVFIWNVVRSWRRGPVAEANPWRATTLEWLTTSPPPLENFPGSPEVVGAPYGYGLPDGQHANVPVPVAGGSDDGD